MLRSLSIHGQDEEASVLRWAWNDLADFKSG